MIAAAAGYIIGVFAGFLMNKHFTFQSSAKSYTIEITKYLMVYATSLLLALGLLRILVFFGMHATLAYIATIVVTTITNFLGCKLFVFNHSLWITKVNFLIYRHKYLIRYMTIGVSAVFLEIFMIEVLTLAQKSLNITFHLYGIILTGFFAGVLLSFYLNAKINFPVPKERNLRTFRMFLIISLASFLLNLGLMKVLFSQFAFLTYDIMRFVTGACIFLISYGLHRRFTFIDIKEVGIAVYLKKSEDIEKIKEKIGNYPDFIHIDLVDKTYYKDADEIELSRGEQIKKEWPSTKKMIHIMSKHPSEWIKKVHSFVDYAIFHLEIDEDIDKVIALCKEYDCKPGIAILYNTSVEGLLKYADKVNIVQVLGIPQPGYSNQHLHPLALEKLEILNAMKQKYHFDICFDGGVKLSNITKINAKYIVSGSTVLNAEDAMKVIYDLKTNSRYYVEHGKDLKTYLQKEIKRIASTIPYLVSGTVAGSFVNSEGLEGISDIDIILIIDSLTKKKYKEIISAFESIKEVLKVDYDYDLMINSTFGPLKFNKDKTVVFHLMIYDLQGHILHCKKSPFTCLDWQHSSFVIKAPMTQVFTVTALQPNYFFNARRSVKEYLQDLEAGSISYREYAFKGNAVHEVKKEKKMDSKDKIEFSYHIMKFCMLNFLKLYTKEYRTYENGEVLKKYFEIFPWGKEKYTSYFLELKKQKENNAFSKNENHALLYSFLKDFEKQFKEHFETHAMHIYFVRHAKTEMNEPGVFLGQKSNPDILPGQNFKNIIQFVKEKGITELYTSALKRALQGIEVIKQSLKIKHSTLNDDLLEIDYGKADGKNIEQVQKEYPALIKAWKEHKDARFPNGESYADVLKRINHFLDTLVYDPKKKMLVCTHNVVLRCLIGNQWNLPLHQWHKIPIEHLDPIEMIQTKDKKWFINLTPEQQEQVFKSMEKSS